MKIVCSFQLKEVRWTIAESDCQRIAARFPGVEMVSIEDPALLADALRDAEVFFGWVLPHELFAGAAKLRWVHTALAGVESVLFPELVASEVIVTNAAGLHNVSIPEHVLGQMLVLSRNFHESLRLQARSEWNRFQAIIFGAGVRELNDANLAVLGVGAIGESVTRMAGQLGMHVRVLRRHPATPVEGAEKVVGPTELHDLLGWADFVVLAVPLTAETDRLIDANALAAMKSSAYLINVARGEVIDDDALVDALRRGAIAGAALDVFRDEPLPSEHPFWTLPNLVLTPHVSGYTPHYFQRSLELFEANLERYVKREPLLNLVDKQLGYARR